MVYQLCTICQEYLDTHFYKPQTGRLPSMYDKLLEEREIRKKNEELEMQKLAEQKQLHNVCHLI
jgi:hypothetical protein